MKFISPLRYPGGKAALANFLEDTIDLNDLRGNAYYEAFAGGAGAALQLLGRKVVSELFINDADVRVFAFWQSAMEESDRFVDKILSVPLTIEEWKRQNEICTNPKKHEQFDIGFSAFFMNRCNRSGVLTGAGPIGGYSQAGKWKLNVRFNREGLAQRITNLSKMRQQIHVTGFDAIDFLKKTLPRGKGRKKVFAYLDPPYVIKGQRLYLNAYNKKDHISLSKYILTQDVLPWVMSYDDNELVRSLYFQCQRSLLPIRYSLQKKRTANELMIAPTTLRLPVACRLGNNSEYLLEAIA